MQPRAVNQETPDIAGSVGPTEKARVVPKVLKKKITLPITGEVDLPRPIREAMEYRVEVVPLVRDEGSVVARSELRTGEKPIAYEVLRRGNELEGLNPQFSPGLDRIRFNALEDPQAAEKALQKAQELATQKLDLNTIIRGYDKADPETQERLVQSAFGKALDKTRGQEVPPPEKEAEPARPEPGKAAPDNADLLQDWPRANPPEPHTASQEPQKDTKRPPERHAPTPLLTYRNRPLVLDHGDRITVTRRAMMGIGTSAKQKRENAVSTALQAAVERFGQPIHFNGNPKFLRETAEMAVKLGIQLEPGSKLAAELYREAQERAGNARENTLGPARKTQEPQKALQQDHGLER